RARAGGGTSPPGRHRGAQPAPGQRAKQYTRPELPVAKSDAASQPCASWVEIQWSEGATGEVVPLAVNDASQWPIVAASSGLVEVKSAQLRPEKVPSGFE